MSFQAYGCASPGEIKEKILWARFEFTDLNDPTFHTDALEQVSIGPPILLILGYSFGVQVGININNFRPDSNDFQFFILCSQIWSISPNGEATELLSWFHGTAKFLKLLPSPLADQNQKQDPFTHRRPLAAICDGASSSQFCSINFLSLRGGDVVSIWRSSSLRIGHGCLTFLWTLPYRVDAKRVIIGIKNLRREKVRGKCLWR